MIIYNFKFYFLTGDFEGGDAAFEGDTTACFLGGDAGNSSSALRLAPALGAGIGTGGASSSSSSSSSSFSPSSSSSPPSPSSSC
jgi:hypothetical protein